LTDARPQTATGSAYGRPPQHSNKLLTEVGPGTPLGELMRRYWHPIAGAADVTGTPRKVRILGEDLILFRDKQGRPGLLYPRCMHRGTSLYYGKIEDQGIRCCYHGWLFDVEGNCLEQPCEPNGGLRRDLARQPWYPLQELYGLVFAYLGPLEKKPVLPRYDILEDLQPGERLVHSIGGRAATGDDTLDVLPYSWLHMCDNIMDPYHVYVLHSTFTDIQFHPGFAVELKNVEFFPADHGVCYSAVREMTDGREFRRVSTYLMPNIMSVPPFGNLQESRSISVAWVVPVDDTHFFQLILEKTSGPSRFAVPRPSTNGKAWGDMTEAERRELPNDYEAQAGQGPISLHSEEHLATSDRGIAMQRRLLTQQIKVVQDGGDPLGVTFDPANSVFEIRSGNFYRPSQAAE
jgi:nitrite reductase/ring-hydroxylating ferredoxin subunit